MEQEITTSAENPLQPKDRNEKAIEVEEGEVNDSKHKSASKSKENGENDEDGDKKAKHKKHKKEKKNKESKKEREDSEERHKKKKESKSKNKKSDRRDRRSSSRSESPKKKHRSSPSFSKKSKSNRKKSVSPSNSRSRSKSKYESRHHKNRSRTPDKKRRRDRSDSRSRRRSPRGSPRRHDRRSPVRSPGRNDRRRERSPVKQRDDRDKRREEKEKKVVEEPKNDLEERIKATMEDEKVDEEANQRLEMALGTAEEDEERLARERREQRRRLLEQFAKANDQAEAQKQKTIEEEPKVEAKQVNNNTAAVTIVKEEPKKMVEEVAPVEKKEEEKKVSVTEERKIEEENDEDDDKEEAKEDGVRKLSAMMQNNHNIEKEKKLKIIESMREQLQKEEEALNAEREEEERRNKAKQEEEAAAKSAKKEQDFDMFAETPETLEAEKVSRPTLNVGQESYDDDQGYYRGQIGELIQERYQISAKLGKGVFGNVFKGIDTQTNQEVAIKIVKSDEIYTISGLKEREILTMLNTADKHNKRHVIRLLDSFEYRKHLVLIFELMEMDLRGAIKTFGKKLGLSIESVRSYARQLFIALSHLRKHKIIHADLKPDNILVTNGQKTLKLADFGSAFTTEENTITPYLVARYYRAPEIMLGCAYDTAVDMWSAACTIFELYTGKILFNGRDNNEMLKMIIQTKGRFNNKMLKRGEFSSQYFDNQHNFLSTEIDPVTKEKYVKPIPIGNKITRDIGTLLNAVEIELNEEDRKKLAQLKELLERCLTLDPNKRLTPDEALKHPFINYGMQKIALDPTSIKHAF